MRSLARAITGLLLALTGSSALAGPPFLTDDPEPTETGHWEIYAPMAELNGQSRDRDGALGVEVNYGAAPGLQLTLGVSSAMQHSDGRTQWGMGDIEMSAKYQFYRSADDTFSIAAFPGITLPTASHHLGADHVTALLPVWAQKDIGAWSVFGGGGYAINPGAGNRDYWTGGIAVTREITSKLLLGIEADRDGPDSADARATTSLGIGAIWQITPRFRLLASGGPTLPDGPAANGFHAFAAIGADF